MRIVFMGTPDFATPVLHALVDAGHDVAAVYTRPDRRAGRGKRLTAPPAKRAALELGLSVRQPTSLRRDEDAQRGIRQLAPDAIVVAAYGLFLPPDTLRAPSLGCVNIHPSLLPRYRGPSPVVSMLLDGDESTGVTLMIPDEGMDTGPILAARETAISEGEDAPALTARLFEMGADLLVETLPAWERGEVLPRAQDDAQASVTSLVRREHGEIDWRRSASQVERMTRAYRPWPGAFTTWRGSVLKVVDARVRESGPDGDVPPPGRVVALSDGGVGVQTGDGVLELSRVQLAGRGASDARDFTRGYRDFLGSRLGE